MPQTQLFLPRTRNRGERVMGTYSALVNNNSIRRSLSPPAYLTPSLNCTRIPRSPPPPAESLNSQDTITPSDSVSQVSEPRRIPKILSRSWEGKPQKEQTTFSDVYHHFSSTRLDDT